MENLNTEVEVTRAKPGPKPKVVEVIKTEKDRNKELIEKMRKRDSRMVRGRFVFHEVPGGKLTFPFKQYPGDPVKQYEFTDGDIVTIPLGVANHLNTNVCVPQHQWLTDENGRPRQRLTGTTRRASFQPLDFAGGVDDELELPQIKSIITVENI